MNRPLTSLCLLLMATLLLPAAQADMPHGIPTEFNNLAHEQQYQKLVRELRCTLCQGGSIYESNAPLAADMRRRVYQMTAAGHTEAEVVAFMVERYGDYIRYRPALQLNTLLLWLSPVLLLLLGVLCWYLVVLRKPAAAAAAPHENLASTDTEAAATLSTTTLPTTALGNKVLMATAVAVPVLALSIYLAVGDPAAVSMLHGAQPASAEFKEYAALTEALENRLLQEPDDLAGWLLLARSHQFLGNDAQAVLALAQAVTLDADNADLLVDYANALGQLTGSLNGEPSVRLQQALAIDPEHPHGLWLAGTAAYLEADYVSAQTHWQLLLALLPADSELAFAIEMDLAELRTQLD